MLATDHAAPTNLCRGVGEYRVGRATRPWFLHSAASALGAFARAAGLLFSALRNADSHWMPTPALTLAKPAASSPAISSR
jgi:hypothetical protein